MVWEESSFSCFAATCKPKLLGRMRSLSVVSQVTQFQSIHSVSYLLTPLIVASIADALKQFASLIRLVPGAKVDKRLATEATRSLLSRRLRHVQLQSELEATVRETLSPAVRLVCGPRRRFGVPVVRRARQTPRSCRRKRRPATGCFSRSPVASAWPQR